MIRGQIHVVPHEDIFKDRYDTLFSEAISRGLKAEQKGRVHWEQKELPSKHVTKEWGLQSKIKKKKSFEEIL